MHDYLAWFVDNHYGLALLPREGGAPRDIPDLGAFLATWGDQYRIENFLLTPR
jgi:hypothetical protein